MGRCSYCWAEGSKTSVELIRCENETDIIVEMEDGMAHVCEEHLDRVHEILEDGSGMILAEDPGEEETIH